MNPFRANFPSLDLLRRILEEMKSGGEFLNDMSNPDNQIATIGDLPTGATGTFETSDSKLVTVINGIITSIDPLT